MPPGVGRRGAVPEAPALPFSGSICPAFQPRRWEADGAGMVGGGGEAEEGMKVQKSSPQPAPWERRGKARTRESCWEMGLCPQNRRGRRVGASLFCLQGSKPQVLHCTATGDLAGRNRTLRKWARGERPGEGWRLTQEFWNRGCL